jgi:hypothetical protein
MMNYVRIAAGILLVIGIIVVGGFLYDPFGWKEHRLEKAEVAAALSRGEAVKAQQEVGLAKDTVKVISAAKVRDSKIEGINNANVSSIKNSAGASGALTPELVASINRGLCEYESTPSCPGN